jgi:hypothetical protein
MTEFLQVDEFAKDLKKRRKTVFHFKNPPKHPKVTFKCENVNSTIPCSPSSPKAPPA